MVENHLPRAKNRIFQSFLAGEFIRRFLSLVSRLARRVSPILAP
jgi:hypothetical protein